MKSVCQFARLTGVLVDRGGKNYNVAYLPGHSASAPALVYCDNSFEFAIKVFVAPKDLVADFNNGCFTIDRHFMAGDMVHELNKELCETINAFVRS